MTQIYIGKYKVISELGAGCFSRVVAAVHQNTGEKVAIKIIYKNKSNPDLVKGEIQALERTRGHPHIVQLYEVLEDNEHVYVVMECCSHGNLHDYLVQNGAVSEPVARLWFLRLLMAIRYCHDNGVVHRDIKNANIFLTVTNGQLSIKLGDFGLSSAFDTSAYTTQLKTAAGSSVFAAPEVYRTMNGKVYYGPSADLWSCGAVLHSMLCRKLPFVYQNYCQTWSTYKAPSTLSSTCQAVLNALMQVDPLKRPDIHQLLKHGWCLESAFSTQPVRRAILNKNPKFINTGMPAIRAA